MNDDVTLGGVAAGQFLGVSETDALVDVVSLMASESVDRAVVLRGEEPVGVVAAHDLLDRVVLEGGVPDVPVSAVMGPPPPVVEPSADVSTAVSELTDAEVDLLVVADDEVRGTVTADDVLAARSARPPSPGGAAGEASAEPGREAEVFDDQGICEGCGALTGTLAAVDGRLLCPDCRPV